MKNYIGLKEHEVSEIRKKYGRNIIEEKKKNVFLDTLFNEVKNPIVIMLGLAGAVSYLIGEIPESIAILAVVVLNFCFTLFQVYKADNAVAALKSLIHAECIVIRNGIKLNLSVDELVPDDIVYLEAGARVPADILVLEATYTEVNESILTGESQLVSKKVSDDETGKLFMGTSVVVGQLYGKVIATGGSTAFGKIAETMRNVDEAETNLQKKLSKLTRTLGIFGVVGAGIVFILAFVQDKGLFESFLLTISLAVAVVPEGLPAVMTAILSIGVGQMAKKGVIMRRLDAIEGLGDITILATDKTGTLTQNKMSVSEIWMRSKWDTKISVDEILHLSFVTNTSVTKVPTIDGNSEYLGDPTEIALREYDDSRKDKSTLEIELLGEKPFSSETRTRSVTVGIGNKAFTCVNGAPESLLENTSISQQEVADIHMELQKCASKGLRTIAFGISEKGGPIEFIGFVSLKDPLRPGIKDAITDARDMGIRTILITGDNPLTAEAIAVEAGITQSTGAYVIGSMLDSMSDEKLMETLGTVNVFARISPLQKLRLVTLLQKKGEIVAMTGDGVNDAPALKQADIGVAMGKVGTDVAKEAADAVVTDDNYVTMIDGIKEGRAIVRRIELATMFFVAGNIGEFAYILFALLLNLPLISPLQILFINLVTDALPALALAVAPVKVLGRKSVRTALLGKAEYIYVAVGASILSASTIFAVWHTKENIEVSKVVAFVMLMMLQQVMLVDVWLGLIRHTNELKKVLNIYLIGAISLTVIMIVALFKTPFFIDLFDLVEIPLSAYVYFLYGVALYAAYVLTRVHKIR